ncbi:MAG TPA: thioredoxin family protein [Saprospiraceae bacterium]|nr:thioredoxin family protein [Saprospiraceae bacterium]
MKRTINNYLSLFLLTTLFPLSLAGQGIEFFKGDWEEVLQEAKAQGKPIFVDAYASWCGPCKRMARTTFQDSKVGEFMNEQFVPAKFDMEKAAGIRFGEKFPVQSYPTLFFIDYKGELLLRTVGAKDSEKLLEIAQSVLDNIDYSKDYQEAYEKGERAPQFILDYVISLNRSGKNSQVVANDYFREQNPDLSEAINQKILFHAVQYVDSRLFDMMVEQMPDIKSYFSQAEIKNQILQAAKNTVERSIEYQVEDILAESMATVKAYLPKEHEEFVVVHRLEYYKSIKDKEKYAEAAEDFVDYYFNEDNEKVFDLCIECVELFEKDESFLEFSEKHLKKLSRKEDKPVYLQALAQVYFYMNEPEKALKYAEKARKMAIEQRKSTKAIDQLIRRIDS